MGESHSNEVGWEKILQIFKPSAKLKKVIVFISKIGKMKKTNILFVCKYNMFRSRVAESYFNKFNKNNNFQAKSAGVFKSVVSNPNQRKLARKFGLEIGTTSKKLDASLLRWADIIILTADDVPKSLFKSKGRYPKKIIVWKIEDKNSNLKLIIKKVKALIRKLEKLK